MVMGQQLKWGFLLWVSLGFHLLLLLILSGQAIPPTDVWQLDGSLVAVEVGFEWNGGSDEHASEPEPTRPASGSSAATQDDAPHSEPSRDPVERTPTSEALVGDRPAEVAAQRTRPPEPAAANPRNPDPRDPSVAEEAMEQSTNSTENPTASANPVISPTQLANRAFVESLIGRPGGPSGTCEDPIVGVWRAHRYEVPGRHVAFTLRITSREGNRLTGTIVNRAWSGSRSQTRPPRCAPGVVDDTTTMPATGTLVGTHFHFDALRFDRRTNCYSSGGRYYLDHFDGQLMGARLGVTNNDGAADINQPYVFRRIGCL